MGRPPNRGTEVPRNPGQLRLLVRFAALAVGTAVLIAGWSSLAAAQVGPFNDVPHDAFYTKPVVELDRAGIFDGTAAHEFMCPGGFCPSDPIDRATIAVWVVRILDGQDPEPWTGSRFDDVDCCLRGFWPPFIERMAELGVTRGCGDGSGFCPSRKTTRAEMAALLSRAFNLPDGPDPDFSDVPADAWYAPDVARLKASGITVGCGDGTRFCPGRITTRAEMATFLYRALRLTGDQTEVHDLVEPPSLYEALAYDAIPSSGNIDIVVHYCAEQGRYNSDDLTEEVTRLNRTVAALYWRETSGKLNLMFVPGTIMEPETVSWNSETFDDVSEDRTHSCRLLQRSALVLIDLPPLLREVDGTGTYTVVSRDSTELPRMRSQKNSVERSVKAVRDTSKR